MRFRLHTKSASSGQVKRNETAIAALSSQVDALQVDVDAISPGSIEIVTGVNDTFVFRVSNNVYTDEQLYLHENALGDVIYPTETYILVLAGRGYTPTEMAAALNVAIVGQLNHWDTEYHEYNSAPGTLGITSTVVLEDDKFAIKCTSAADTTLVRGIDILGSSDGVSNSAGETLGFVVDQSIGPVTFGVDLTLVATNGPIATQSAVATQSDVAALSSQVDALQVDVDAISPSEGGIEITGVNGAFVFRHALALTSNYTTYTINLDQGVYTTDELVAALNAAIEAQGSVVDLSGHFTGLPEAFTITTSIAYIDGHFLIRCSCTIAHPYGIEILSDATAAESLGFEQNQTAGVFGAFTADDILSFIGDDLNLVATNEAVVIASASDNKATIDALLLRVDELESAGLGGTSLVTTQVTGEYPVPTVGTLNISDAVLTPVTFADAFSNGISHAYGASIFNVTAAGDYTINIQLRVTTGFDADRGNNANRGLYYWAICRRYKNRTAVDAIGTAISIISAISSKTSRYS